MYLFISGATIQTGIADTLYVYTIETNKESICGEGGKQNKNLSNNFEFKCLKK